jgi:sterol 3beta-glucosyltransferase
MSRKLNRKRRDSRREARGMSLDVPERFRDGDDAQEDVTAPKRTNTMSMNQSLFSMIARAGQQSQADLGTMQEVDSGDSDDGGKHKATYRNLDGAARLSRLSSANDFQSPAADFHDATAEKGKHRRTLSENKLLRSLPKLKLSSRKEARSESHRADQMSSSQFLPPKPSPDDLPSPPPKTKDKNKMTAGDDIRVEKGKNSGRKSRHGSTAGLAKSKAPVTLAQRIQQIFEFEEVEEVISEYACWLLQSILLQGYMYVTQKHICFYAYIPKKHASPSVRHIRRSNLLTPSSTTSAKQATFPNAAAQSSTVTGSSSAATS